MKGIASSFPTQAQGNFRQGPLSQGSGFAAEFQALEQQQPALASFRMSAELAEQAPSTVDQDHDSQDGELDQDAAMVLGQDAQETAAQDLVVRGFGQQQGEPKQQQEAEQGSEDQDQAVALDLPGLPQPLNLTVQHKAEPAGKLAADSALKVQALAAGQRPIEAQAKTTEPAKLQLAAGESFIKDLGPALEGRNESRLDALAGAPRLAAMPEWASVKVNTASSASGSQSPWQQDLMAALGDRLQLQVNQQVKEARVRLDPPELGRVEMTVRLDGDKLSVQLQANHPQVRDALQAQVDRLRLDLSQSHGAQVDVSVGQQSSGQQQQQAFAAQGQILAGLSSNPVHEEETDTASSEGWVSALA